MAKINWDSDGFRYYETGVDRGVLFVEGLPGVPWNGLTGVSEESSAGEKTEVFLDGVKTFEIDGEESFSGSIKAFNYPPEFSYCDGTFSSYMGIAVSNQPKRPFSFSYRTKVGNDTLGETAGYKIHFIYNATAAPSGREYSTVGQDVEAIEFEWSFNALPIRVPGYKAVSQMTVDSRATPPDVMAAVEAFVYGTDTLPPRMPTPSELIHIFESSTTVVLKITDLGDGTFVADGPDTVVSPGPDNEFTIDWPSVLLGGDGAYQVGTL
jgi:hypothetical protein